LKWSCLGQRPFRRGPTELLLPVLPTYLASRILDANSSLCPPKIVASFLGSEEMVVQSISSLRNFQYKKHNEKI
jgi:hypothetical protein